MTQAVADQDRPDGEEPRAPRRRWLPRLPKRRPVPAVGGPDDTAPVDVAPIAAPALDTVDWQRWYPALIFFAAGVVAVTFALSYHGLYEFAHTIVNLPYGLAIMVPVGVDVFSLCCLSATFLARDAPLRVRLYCWLMFAFTVGVSVGGNAVYAISDVQRRAVLEPSPLRWGYLQVGAVIGAALWPAFSAGALHLLIIIRRHLQRQRDKIKLLSHEAEKAEAVETLLQARAIKRVVEGATVSDILAELKLPADQRRRVERWTEPIRAALAAPKPAVVAAKATSRRTTSVRTNTTQ